MVCNGLIVDEAGYICGHRPHHVHGKAGAVEHFQHLGFQVCAVGDSYNDLAMLQTADAGILFSPCPGLAESVRQLPVAWNLQEKENTTAPMLQRSHHAPRVIPRAASVRRPERSSSISTAPSM